MRDAAGPRMDAARADVATGNDASADVAPPRDAMPTPGLCPNVLIALDNSCSMSQAAGDSGLSKWQAAVNALGTLLPATDAHARYGLSLFPCPTCTPGCAEPPLTSAVSIEPASGTASTIGSALGMAGRVCSTPTAPYLTADLADPALNDPARASFVLLITDGAPTCGVGGAAAIPATVDAIDALRARGIKTFVIGFDANVDGAALDMFAVAGGEPLPAGTAHRYYDVTDEASLGAALDAISRTVSEELGSSLCDESCYAQGCPAGELCVASACVADPCAAVTCGAGQYCADATCHTACPTGCPTGQLCQEGACVVDPCVALGCEGCFDGVCPTGACLAADGGVVQCGVGRVCRGDACVDSPCLHVRCPAGTVCEPNGACSGTISRFDDAGSDGAVDAGGAEHSMSHGTGSSTCACRATPGARGRGGAWAALALALALATRRRARRVQ